MCVCFKTPNMYKEKQEISLARVAILTLKLCWVGLVVSYPPLTW